MRVKTNDSRLVIEGHHDLIEIYDSPNLEYVKCSGDIIHFRKSGKDCQWNGHADIIHLNASDVQINSDIDSLFAKQCPRLRVSNIKKAFLNQCNADISNIEQLVATDCRRIHCQYLKQAQFSGSMLYLQAASVQTMSIQKLSIHAIDIIGDCLLEVDELKAFSLNAPDTTISRLHWSQIEGFVVCRYFTESFDAVPSENGSWRQQFFTEPIRGGVVPLLHKLALIHPAFTNTIPNIYGSRPVRGRFLNLGKYADKLKAHLRKKIIEGKTKALMPHFCDDVISVIQQYM